MPIYNPTEVVGGYTQGARVYNSADIVIADSTWVKLTFDSERFDTDNIHSIVSNTSRLTCRTAGIYLVVAAAQWRAAAGGVRRFQILLNNTDVLQQDYSGMASDNYLGTSCQTIVELAVNDYVEFRVVHNQGAPLNIGSWAMYSPEFMMQRIG